MDSLQFTAAQTNATEVNPLRQSSRIAERRAKLGKSTKSTKDSVTDKTNQNIIQISNDPAPKKLKESTFTPTPISISKLNSEPALTSIFTPSFGAPSSDKTTNKIFDEMRNANSLPNQTNVKDTAEEIQNMIEMPIITKSDYLEDEFFKPIYLYLKDDELTGNKKIDRKTLLLQENYFLENSLLYKLLLPRTQK